MGWFENEYSIFNGGANSMFVNKFNLNLFLFTSFL